MNTLRNVSDQSFLIQRTGGAVVHLLPGRAVALADEELKSPQVQRLIDGGLARVQKIALTSKATKAKTPIPEPEKPQAPERTHAPKKAGRRGRMPA
jgi:hypothetical protein